MGWRKSIKSAGPKKGGREGMSAGAIELGSGWEMEWKGERGGLGRGRREEGNVGGIWRDFDAVGCCWFGMKIGSEGA